MKTIKTLNNVFEKYVEDNVILHSYSFGPLYDISTTETNYPLLHFIPINEETINGANILSFKIILLDLLSDDKSNKLDITTELQQSKNDIVGYFRRISEDYGFYLNSVKSNFTEGYDDLLVVIEIDFNIQYQNDISCLINNID